MTRREFLAGLAVAAGLGVGAGCLTASIGGELLECAFMGFVVFVAGILLLDEAHKLVLVVRRESELRDDS